jgi:hypothetical protein
MNAVQVRSEEFQGRGDDTATNNLNMKCSTGRWISGDGAGWGGWVSKHCGSNQFICGMQVQLEGKQGNGDDTALNRLHAALEHLYIIVVYECRIEIDSKMAIYFIDFSKLLYLLTCLLVYSFNHPLFTLSRIYE